MSLVNLCSLIWEKCLCKWYLNDGSGHDTYSWKMWVGPNVLTSGFPRKGHEDSVKAEAEIGVIWLKAKECWHGQRQQPGFGGSFHFSLGKLICLPECKN